MAETKIKMAHVLAEIDQYEQGGRLHTFSIGYVKTNGQTGFKKLVRKSGIAVTPYQGLGQKIEGSKFRINIKNNGLLMLVDHLTGNPFTLKIALITHYNGHRIQH